MKIHPAKTASVLLLASAMGSDAFAHVYTGRLAAKETSTARYAIACFDDGNGPPESVYFDVKAFTKTATFLVTAQIEKNGVADSVTDKTNGDRKPSPAKVFIQGDGVYNLTLSKVKKKSSQPDKKLKGVMVFNGDVHCYSTTGAHTGTDMTKLP